MAMKKYNEYLQVNPSFESVVDIAADSRNKNLWREYIVGDDMEKLMDFLCQTLGYETPDARRSLWVHGSYGTGKSYAAIFVKHLLEEKKDTIDTFLQNNQRLSKYRNRFLNCRKNGDYLVIWKTGCTGIRTGDQLLVEAEFAIREALVQKFGDRADLGVASLQDGVKAQLHNRNINWEHVLDSTILGEDYGDVEELIAAVERGDLKATKAVAEVIRANHWGLINNVETFKKWVEEIIVANHLEKSGIFFIWDEFTDYLRHSDDQVVMQQISEFCKEQPLFMCFIVHKDSSWVDVMGNATYQQITHRFHEVEFHVSADAAYDLIAGSISIRNGMDEYWKEARKDPVHNIKKFLPDIAGLDDKISEKINELCPMHPMTVRLLSSVAENFAAAQRTMFRFMKDSSNETQGFLGYITKYGPQDQACWLTPDWLWDYFFTRESDFHDKETKAPEYIRHYEENRYLVENDENAHRVFKIAMLLMAVMSTTKGLYTTRRTSNGVAATVECLENCLSGVLSKSQVDDYLATFEDTKILLCDEQANGVKRLQMPFKMAGGDDFAIRYEQNDKKYTRYQMFAKDGKLTVPFEKVAWDENDATFRRMKIVVCCAEKASLDKRIKEVTDDLDKYPYKLGLVYVTVVDDAQAISIQHDLETRAQQSGENRLIIVLVRSPFTDDMRKKWLTSLTKADMARDSGHTADAGRYDTETATIIQRWVGSATSGGKMLAWCGEKQWNNLFGVAQLRKTIQTAVLEDIFPYAPESVVITNTAYKSCNDSAPLAGIQRETRNAQLFSVLAGIKQLGIIDATTIQEIEGITGSRAANTVSALAKFLREKMESGRKVVLGDVWAELQQPPFGFYNTIACGVLLGFVFSCYKDSAYSWTDSSQGTFVLNESNLKTLVLNTCKGNMTTDYLSAGSVTWQNFRNYIKKIFKLDDGQTANETEGMRSVRERITQTGAPFWCLKYLSETELGGIEMKEAAGKIIDNMQVFISQEGNTDEAMSNVIQLFSGRGKLRERMTKAFQDKAVVSKAFSAFLFEASSELKEITDKLSVQPEGLRDKVFGVMQNAVYTWTEDQVKEKLVGVVSEYRYLDVLNATMRNTYNSNEEAIRDLKNAFNHMRVAILAIEPLNLPWYDALVILHRVSQKGITQMSCEERENDIDVLRTYGTQAWECIRNVKPVLSTILEQMQIECTPEELQTIYEGLKDVSCDATANQFEKDLKQQTGRISQRRNRSTLLERWKTLSSTENVKTWSNARGIPLLWVVPKNASKAIRTLIAVQNDERALDQDVLAAINVLDTMDHTILTDNATAEQAFMNAIGANYRDVFEEQRKEIITELKLKLGSDVSAWDVSDLITVQSTLKKYQAEKAKKEKLQSTQNHVKGMSEDALKDKVSAFLNAHPEFCDDFNG